MNVGQKAFNRVLEVIPYCKLASTVSCYYVPKHMSTEYMTVDQKAVNRLLRLITKLAPNCSVPNKWSKCKVMNKREFSGDEPNNGIFVRYLVNCKNIEAIPSIRLMTHRMLK